MPKNKRLLLFATVAVVGGALLTLVFSSFTDALVYFLTPTEVKAQAADIEGRRIRIGGMVQAGSLERQEGTLKVGFLVTDGDNRIPVTYDGVLPDLFREGQGVVVEGTWIGGRPFAADSVLAKHSEDYMPVEMTEEGIEAARDSLMRSLQ